MAEQASVDDVFRFVRVGPTSPPALVAELRRTAFYTLLETKTPSDRVAVATAALATSHEIARRIEDVELGSTILAELVATLESAPQPTVNDFLARVPPGVVHRPELQQGLKRLSDTLLLSIFAPGLPPAFLDELRRLYIAYLLIEAAPTRPDLLNASLRRILQQTLLPAFLIPKPKAKVQSVGVADLLVVRQHIKRYEACEIAHVENVMPFETRSREHRQLERYEEMVTTETETTTEKEEEVTSTERYELEREAQRTLKEDQKYSFDLNISGQYGPVIEFDTGFGLEVSRSEETQSRNATRYARDVVQRSLERVKERVREERIRRITRETEERNLHSFTNETANGASGIYQFIDKVYEAQVFNYGKRQMFDFMIPEPAAYLWFLEQTSQSKQAELPPAPEPLDVTPLDLLYLPADEHEPAHYTLLGAKYGASELDPPPPSHVRTTIHHLAPAGTETPGAASEHGDALVPPTIVELPIPPGYRPERADLYTQALTDNVDHLQVSFGVATATSRQVLDTTTDRSHVGGNDVDGQQYLVRGHNRLLFAFTDSHEVYQSEAKLQLSIFPYETANHAIVCEVRFERGQQSIDEWKLKTYEKIRAAYLNRVLEYKDEVNRVKAELKAQQSSEERVLGAPPTQRKQTIVTELKKQCIAILRQQWYADSPVMIDSTAAPPTPPTFNFTNARLLGSAVRFFEHAFQWDQIQYAFYPYFWARQGTWENRFRKEDPDYDFQQFLQAGSARVVLAVRPGFEAAVTHFLETGELWEGRGEPTITDPLYRTIVDEIRERSDAGLDAIPEGEPWEVRLPTSLILLRPQELRPILPEWERSTDGTWTWTPVVTTEA